MTDKRYCQIPGCRRLAARAVSIDMPAAWEATATFTSLTVYVDLCDEHGQEVERRVQAMLEARVEFANLVAIIEAAVRYEKSLELRLQAASA
jgi:hypothetical protein